MGKKKNCILITPKENSKSEISEVLINKKYLDISNLNGKEPTFYHNNKFPYYDNYDKIYKTIRSINLQWSYLPYHKDKFPNLIMIFPSYRSWDIKDMGEYVKSDIRNRTAIYINKRHKIHGRVILYDTQKDMSMDYYKKILDNSKMDTSAKEFKKYNDDNKNKGSVKVGKDKKVSIDLGTFNVKKIESKTRDETRKEYIDFLIKHYIFTFEDIDILNSLIYNIYVKQKRKFYQTLETNAFSDDPNGLKIIEMNDGISNKNANYMWEEEGERKKIDIYTSAFL